MTRIELLDQRGKCLATIIPTQEPTAEDYARVKALFSDEDLDRAESQAGGSTTQEVLARLRA